MYTFSIIIPVFNTEKYLRECVDSILKQDNKDLEIILIDDGSTDKSGEICDLYYKKNKRVKAIHQINSGPSISRNCGLDIATGNYIMFMDSDDFLANNKVISNFVSIFEEQNCDIIYGVYKGFIDDDYKTCTYKIYPKVLKINNTQTKDLCAEEIIQLLFDIGNYYSSPTIKIYKREFLENHGFRFKAKTYLEDEVWTPKILLNCSKVYFYDEEFYMRRIREESIMTTTDDERLLKKIVDMIEIAIEMTEYIDNVCKSDNLKTTFREYYKSFRIGCVNLSNEINNQNIKDKAVEIIAKTDKGVYCNDN